MKFFVLFFVFISLLFVNISYAAKRILIVNSYHIGMIWEDQVTASLIKNLQEDPLDIEIYVEYLDLKRYKDPIAPGHPEYSVWKKYKNTKPDVMIVCDDRALKFVLKTKDNHPYVPIVFTGINNENRVEEARKAGLVGVAELVDIKKSVDLIMKLHPNIRELVSVNDTTPSSQALLRVFNKEKEKYRGKVKFSTLQGWTFDSLKDDINSLGKDTVVLLQLGFYRDTDGNFSKNYKPYDYFKQFDIPIYASWTSQGIGEGTMGGYLVDGDIYGELAAKKAIKILNGVPIEQIGIQYGEGNSYMFDYNYLVKYKISLKEIPKNSIVLNEPLTFFEKYGSYLWLAVTVLTTHSIIGLLLLFNILERKRLSKRENEVVHIKRELEHHQFNNNYKCPKEVSDIFSKLTSALSKLE